MIPQYFKFCQGLYLVITVDIKTENNVVNLSDDPKVTDNITTA